MTTHPLVTQLRFARSEFVRGLDGLPDADGLVRLPPLNALGWMVGHLANQEHRYWVMLAQGKDLAPGLVELVGTGRPASTPPLDEMWSTWRAVTSAADLYLDTLTVELMGTFLQHGRRPVKESVGTLLLRNAYHYWFHTGEASAVRQLLGHRDLPEFVGDMSAAIYRPEADLPDPLVRRHVPLRCRHLMDGTDHLTVSRAGTDGALAVLTLGRPDVLNAIDSALLGALDRAIATLAGEADLRALILTGAGGRAFSTGMDLRERATFSDDQLREQRRALIALIAHVHELPIPTIAAVEGYARGGGFELALACDLIVASRTATFGLPEVRVGILPGGGATQTLTWIVGPARARDLILTGRVISGEEAAGWGIVARVVEPGDALSGAVALGEAISEGAPLGIRQARAAIRGAHRPLAEGLAAENDLYEVALRSEDRVEGFRAFVEKRRPRFKGR